MVQNNLFGAHLIVIAINKVVIQIDSYFENHKFRPRAKKKQHSIFVVGRCKLKIEFKFGMYFNRIFPRKICQNTRVRTSIYF